MFIEPKEVSMFPSPFEVVASPIALAIFISYAALMIWEAVAPAVPYRECREHSQPTSLEIDTVRQP